MSSTTPVSMRSLRICGNPCCQVHVTRVVSIITMYQPANGIVGVDLCGGARRDCPMEPTSSTAERLPASPAQQQIWLAETLDQGHGTLNDRLAVRLRGPLHTDALRRALVALAERHELLRTVFSVRDDVLTQEIRPVPEIDYAELDVTGRDEQAVRSLAADLAARPFDLAADPPLRVRLLRFQPDEHLFLVVLHHIVG